MRSFKRTAMVALIALAVALPATVAWAQNEQSVRGQLVSVDPDTQTLAVKDATGAQIQIVYNESTRVSGGDGTIEGLAAEVGSQVTVYYTDDGMTKTATRIEIQG